MGPLRTFRIALLAAIPAIAAIRWLAEGLDARRPAGAVRAPDANVPEENREPLALYAAVIVAALLVLGNALLRGKA